MENRFEHATEAAPHPNPLPQGERGFFLCAVLVFLGLVLYAHTLHFPFIYDDDSFVVLNEAIHSLRHWQSFFTNPGTLAFDQELAHDNYRPLVTLSYALSYRFSGLHTFGYRLGNLLFHILNGILLFFIAHDIFNVN